VVGDQLRQVCMQPHAAAEHPGWVARYELVRPLPDQLEAGRVRPAN
jgi:hypothetical protein